MARELRVLAGVARCPAQLPHLVLGARTFATADGKPDYYRVLGVKPDASADQIKHAFREQGAYVRRCIAAAVASSSTLAAHLEDCLFSRVQPSSTTRI